MAALRFLLLSLFVVVSVVVNVLFQKHRHQKPQQLCPRFLLCHAIVQLDEQESFVKHKLIFVETQRLHHVIPRLPVPIIQQISRVGHVPLVTKVTGRFAQVQQRGLLSTLYKNNTGSWVCFANFVYVLRRENFRRILKFLAL